MDEKKNIKRKVEFSEDGKTKGTVEETKEPIKVESPLEEAPKESGEQPIGILALPSRFRVYGIDPSSIRIRTFKGKDEKLIAGLTHENFETKFVEILSAVLEGLDPRELTIGDRLYIMLWETINSYVKFATLEHQCSECFEKSTYDVDLSTLDVVELPDDFKEPYNIKVSGGKEIALRLMRVKDEEKTKNFEKNTKQNPWLYRYALTIVDDKMADYEKMTMLEEMPAIDIALIRAFHEKFYHGPKMEVVVECKKCGVSEVAPMPFRIELFFPYGETLNRYFGNAI